MAKTLATVLTMNMEGKYEDALDFHNVLDRLNKSFGDTMATGTGANQADQMWHDQRTLTAASEELDLSGGGAVALVDGFGDTLTFVKIRCVLIQNLNTTSGHDLTVGAAAATQFVGWFGAVTETTTVDPEGIMLQWSPSDGWAVGAGASDMLKIDAGANTITYNIVILGTSA